jgi:hypothetical protein
MTPEPMSLWHSFGFSSEWREDGFVCAFERGDSIQAEAAIVAIEKCFNQGAIYRVDALKETAGALRRQTIRASMTEQVEADVVVVQCEKPNMPKADSCCT